MTGHSPEAQAAIDSLTEDMRQVVQGIESGLTSGTTQNNYGGYMTAINTLVPDSNRVSLYVVSKAMVAAGGNVEGIKSALRIIAGQV